MNAWQAQQNFWSSFGLPAYDDQTVFTKGDMPAYPHITYESFGGFLGQSTTLTASLWYKTDEWADVKQKATEILNYIGSGRLYDIDTGKLWIQAPDSSPFAQPLDAGNSDGSIDPPKRIVITIEAEILSGY